jgi:hypothetical protein
MYLQKTPSAVRKPPAKRARQDSSSSDSVSASAILKPGKNFKFLNGDEAIGTQVSHFVHLHDKIDQFNKELIIE